MCWMAGWLAGMRISGVMDVMDDLGGWKGGADGVWSGESEA